MLLTYENDIIKSSENITRQKDLERENKSRIDHIYRKDDLVLLHNSRENRKFGVMWMGPYKIIEVPKNTTYVVIIPENDLLEKVTKRRIIPYYTSLERQNVVNLSYKRIENDSDDDSDINQTSQTYDRPFNVIGQNSYK